MKIAPANRVHCAAGLMAAIGGCFAAAVWLVVSPVATADPATAQHLFREEFAVPDGLVTNEYAFRNSQDPKARLSPDWEVTSGSLFVKNGAGDTGIPDRISPNADSSNATDSAVFRCRTKKADFRDVQMSLNIFNRGFVTTPKTPAKSYDGIHLWLRYVSEESLYAVTINRRDNIVIIKKKVPGGPSNGGTYYTLKSVPYKVPLNSWQSFTAVTKNGPGGSMTITLSSGDNNIVTVVDNGTVGGPAVTSEGRVGVRGDNCHFQFDSVEVRALP
jgi:hypothetical protein